MMLLMVAAGLASTAAHTAHAQPVSFQGLDDLIDETVANRKIPGIQICILKAGQVIYEKQAGFANLETGTPVEGQSVFRIGSITKEFTAALVLKLVESGRLMLSDPIGQYVELPEDVASLTLHQLLTHTSGLSNYTTVVQSKELFAAWQADISLKDLIDQSLNITPRFNDEPGRSFHYSNTNYVLLGAMLQSVTGQTTADLIRTQISEPLGLATIAVDDEKLVLPKRVSGYFADEDAPTGFRHPHFMRLSNDIGTGDMRATAKDLCLWRAALNAGHVLGPQMKAYMMSRGRLDRPSDPQNAVVDYGGGAFVEDIRRRRAFRGGGNTLGFSAFVDTLVDDGVSFAALTNIEANLGDGWSRFQRESKRLVWDQLIRA